MSLINLFNFYEKENEWVAWAIKCAKWYEQGKLTFETLVFSKASLTMFHYAYYQLTIRNQIPSIEDSDSTGHLVEITNEFASSLEPTYKKYYTEALWLLEIIITVKKGLQY